MTSSYSIGRTALGICIRALVARWRFQFLELHGRLSWHKDLRLAYIAARLKTSSQAPESCLARPHGCHSHASQSRPSLAVTRRMPWQPTRLQVKAKLALGPLDDFEKETFEIYSLLPAVASLSCFLVRAVKFRPVGSLCEDSVKSAAGAGSNSVLCVAAVPTTPSNCAAASSDAGLPLALLPTAQYSSTLPVESSPASQPAQPSQARPVVQSIPRTRPHYTQTKPRISWFVLVITPSVTHASDVHASRL